MDEIEIDKLVQKGQKLLDSAEYSEACKIFHEVHRRLPCNAEHCLRLGCAYLGDEKPRIAFEYFVEAQVHDEDDFRGWYYCGVAFVELWKQEGVPENRLISDALRYFNRADELEPLSDNITGWIRECERILRNHLEPAAYQPRIEIRPLDEFPAPKPPLPNAS